MTGASQPSLHVELYWSLPGPRRFLSTLVQAIESNPVVVVRIDRSHITGVNLALRQALDAAAQHPERAEFIDLEDGVHLESAIGHHFGRETLSALELAAWTAPPRTAIALTPKSDRARERCRAYVEEFTAERRTSARGTTRLVLIWHSGDDSLVPTVGATVSFSGSLSTDEMHAYVALRMVGQHAPGSTSLTRHLVTEFAGSDPLMAEALIALSPSALLQLPESMVEVIPRLVGGSLKSTAGSADTSNVVTEWQVSRTSGPLAKAAAENLNRRYWRACVRSLLPWLEERRLPVLDKLRPTLEEYLYPFHAWKKQNPWNGKTTDIAIEDLEFNDVVAMTFHRQDPLDPRDDRAQRLIAACRHAKSVRDAIAHMRPPTSKGIEDAVRAFEEALQ